MVKWDKDSCSDAGFLKIDLLGLGMLSAVERCVELIAARRDERIDLSRIPFDDPQTFEAIQEAETTGVFQIESRAQMGSLRRTRPENLDDLTDPGGDRAPGADRRRRGQPLHRAPPAAARGPRLRGPLRPPVAGAGAARDAGDDHLPGPGASRSRRPSRASRPGEAEGLRRAMSRKRSEAAIEAYHERFVEGAMATHARRRRGRWPSACGRWSSASRASASPRPTAPRSGCWPTSRRGCACTTAPEFLCALLDEQPMGFYPPDALVHEAQRRGHRGAGARRQRQRGRLHASDAPTGAVRLGLGYVLGVRADEVEALVAAREAAGPFRSLEDLAARAGAGRPALEQLAWSGACDAAGRRQTARRDARCGGWRRRAAAAPRRPGRARSSRCRSSLPRGAGAARARRLGGDDRRLRDHRPDVDRHPLRAAARRACRRGAGRPAATSTRLRPRRARSRSAGWSSPASARGRRRASCFLLLEDELGTVNLIVPPTVYERDRLVVRAEPLVVAEGELERFASARRGDQRPRAQAAWPSTPGGCSIGARRPQVKDFSPLDARELARWQADQLRVAAAVAGGATAAHVRPEAVVTERRAGGRGPGRERLPRGGPAGHELRPGTAAIGARGSHAAVPREPVR